MAEMSDNLERNPFFIWYFLPACYLTVVCVCLWFVSVWRINILADVWTWCNEQIELRCVPFKGPLPC